MVGFLMFFGAEASSVNDRFVSIEEMQSLLDESGFVSVFFEDASSAQPAGAPEPPAKEQLSLSTYVDDLALKAENAMRSVKENQIRLVRAVFEANK